MKKKDDPYFYTPDIRSMWGYIVFAFPLVRSFVFLSQGQSFCVKVYKTSYFEDPLMDFVHIWHDGRYRSKVFISTIPSPGVTLGSRSRIRIFIKESQGQSFYVKVYKTSYFEDPLMDFVHIWHDGRCRSNVFIGTISTPWGDLGVKVTDLNFREKSQSFLCLSLYSYIIKTLEEFHLYLNILTRHDPHPGCDRGQGHELRIFI